MTGESDSTVFEERERVGVVETGRRLSASALAVRPLNAKPAVAVKARAAAITASLRSKP